MTDQEALEVAQLNANVARILAGPTPEERAARIAKRKAERGAQRDAATRVELTLEALLDKLGFTREYAEHLVQPYCDCECGHDGWDYCPHANDLGWPGLGWAVRQ
jgi:hypothetical protein